MSLLKRVFPRWALYTVFLVSSEDRKLAIPVGFWLFVVLPWLEALGDLFSRYRMPIVSSWNLPLLLGTN